MVTGAAARLERELLRPPIRAPEVGDWNASGSGLSDFVRRSQPWSRQRVPLSRRLRRTLWVLIPIDLIWGIWLWIITIGASPCDGLICTVATLDHHAELLLVLVALCLAGLIGLAPTTRGLSQGNDREVLGLGGAAAAGGAALLGIAALLVGAVIVLIVFAAFFAALTATP